MVSHGVFIAPVGGTSVAPPQLLQRTDDDFIAATLGLLSRPEPAAAIAGSEPSLRRDDGALRLFQPVHRTFHLLVAELCCDTPGNPPLEPSKIESAGIVIRRVAASENGRLRRFPRGQAWLRSGQAMRGWVTLRDEAETQLDPDPALRRRPSAGEPEIDRRLALALAAREPLEEDVAPMFVAPPHVRAASGRTLLFGLVPTASPELSDVESPPAFDDDALDELISNHFRAGNGPAWSELAGRTFTAESIERAARTQSQVESFLGALQLLALLADAFPSDGTRTELATLLDELRAPFPGVRYSTEYTPLGEVLARAARVLLLEPSAEGVRMPTGWPEISRSWELRFRQALARAMQRRFAEVAPRVPRFDDPSALYVARVFARVRRDDGCPPALVWSAPTEEFAIVPWFESGLAPPVQVRLPELTNLKAFKPNIAFRMPGTLYNVMRGNKPSDLLAGDGKPGAQSALDWVCSFNIPIITICAFIVLQIFLRLFNIIFFWLPFVRICFPLPRLSTPEDNP